MSPANPFSSLPESPCERRKRMLLAALTPESHVIEDLTIGEVDTKTLIEQGQYQRVIDLYFVYSDYRRARARNNIGCAYALSGDLARAADELRQSAGDPTGGSVRALARCNLRLVLLAMAAAR